VEPESEEREWEKGRGTVRNADRRREKEVREREVENNYSLTHFSRRMKWSGKGKGKSHQKLDNNIKNTKKEEKRRNHENTRESV
jgi:hypothetical protein